VLARTCTFVKDFILHKWTDVLATSRRYHLRTASLMVCDRRKVPTLAMVQESNTLSRDSKEIDLNDILLGTKVVDAGRRLFYSKSDLHEGQAPGHRRDHRVLPK
jgi:hypothetical protein